MATIFQTRIAGRRCTSHVFSKARNLLTCRSINWFEFVDQSQNRSRAWPHRVASLLARADEVIE